MCDELLQVSFENDTDIIMVAEANNLDVHLLKTKMLHRGRHFDKKEILPLNKGIILLARDTVQVSVYKEDAHFSAYKVYDKEKNYLLIVTHFMSAMYKSELARAQKVNELSREISKLEEICGREHKKYHTIIVGDFNLQPFSDGIISVHDFNAIMDENRARKEFRLLDGVERKFYYNPMWQVLGKRGCVPGTYYNENDQDDRSFYWYTFDQILLRPDVIDDFDWNEFAIVEKIGEKNLISENKIDKNRYSDHLPIKFAVY